MELRKVIGQFINSQLLIPIRDPEKDPEPSISAEEIAQIQKEEDEEREWDKNRKWNEPGDRLIWLNKDYVPLEANEDEGDEEDDDDDIDTDDDVSVKLFC